MFDAGASDRAAGKEANRAARSLWTARAACAGRPDGASHARQTTGTRNAQSTPNHTTTTDRSVRPTRAASGATVTVTVVTVTVTVTVTTTATR